MSIDVQRYEPSDPRLGRHVRHDSRSLNYEFLARDAQPKRRNTFWHSNTKPLQQGKLGSCTGNSAAQWLNTVFAFPARRRVRNGRYLTQSDAVHLYSLATTFDRWDGAYPPVDTGSDGLSVAKAGVQLGYLDSYSHTFSFQALQATLEMTPVICGTVWTKSMFNPYNGLVKVGPINASNSAGGHEYMGCGIDWNEGVCIFRNSWGDTRDWPGCKPGGYFAIKFADFQRLLAAQGDVTVLHGKGMP
jgi:hypothetical protein